MPDPGSLLAAALDLASRGWHVFPLRPGDKRPAFPDHTAESCTGRDPRCRAAGSHVGWQARATCDPDRIRRAWTAGAAFNVGVACGPSGLVVVDLDQPKPGDAAPPEAWRLDGVADGFDVFAVVCDRAAQPLPVDTYTVTTGRGGTHLYYRHPDGGPPLRNTQGDRGGLGWLVDTRSHGGYVVAAGSVVAGKPYTVAHDTNTAPLPDWLATTLRPAPLPHRPVAITPTPGRRAGYIEAAIRGQVAQLAAAPVGERNRALFVSALALGQLVAGGALTTADVETALTPAAASIGLTPGETARTIASGLRAGARRPRTVAA